MKMQHMTIFVKDINESVAFYQSVAGLNVVRDLRGGDHQVVFLNDGDGAFCLELAQGGGDMLFSGKGVSLGLSCDDLDREIERLAGMGLKPGEIISPNPNVRFVFLPDPDGFMIQFVEEKGEKHKIK